MVLGVAAGCSSPPRIDATSSDTTKASTERVRSSLPETERSKFDVALLTVQASKLDLAAITAGRATNDDKLAADIKAVLNGKTAAEIFAEADRVDAEFKAKAAARPSSKWSELGSVSRMDDSRGVSFHLDAENEIKGWLKVQRPSLIVRCEEKRTDVYIVTGMPAAVERGNDKHTVRIRFDDEPAEQQNWSESTDKEALFARAAVPLAGRIARAKRLRLEFTPFNASPVVVDFDVSGFDQRVDKVASACGWKP